MSAILKTRVAAILTVAAQAFALMAFCACDSLGRQAMGSAPGCHESETRASVWMTSPCCCEGQAAARKEDPARLTGGTAPALSPPSASRIEGPEPKVMRRPESLCLPPDSIRSPRPPLRV